MFPQPQGAHLAQINVALAADDMASARMASFIAAIPKVNAVAERSPGFVWRLISDQTDVSASETTENPRLAINMSVWESAEAFKDFVWRTIHKKVYHRKADWFTPPSDPTFAMWWIPAGETPTLDTGMAKLALLKERGPTVDAFGWESLPNVALWRSQRCG